MNNTDIILWTEDLSVNVKEIDDQHKHFIDIINKLYKAVEEKDLSEFIDETLQELSDYAKLHFETEEKYFKLFDYSGAEEQITEHDDLKQKLDDIIERRKINDIKVLYDLICFLDGWLQHHFLELDKKYTKCFNEHGLY